MASLRENFSLEVCFMSLQCFQFPNFFRIVLTIPKAKVSVACERIEEFCRAHYSPEKKLTGKLTNGNESH
jgi:hypothetical protein